MDVPENRTNLVESAIIRFLATLAVFGHESSPRSEILLVLLKSEVCFVHLARHVFEVFEDADLVLFVIPIKEGLVRILIVLKSFLCCEIDIQGCRVGPHENFVAVQLFKQFIMHLLLFLQ